MLFEFFVSIIEVNMCKIRAEVTPVLFTFIYIIWLQIMKNSFAYLLKNHIFAEIVYKKLLN